MATQPLCEMETLFRYGELSVMRLVPGLDPVVVYHGNHVAAPVASEVQPGPVQPIALVVARPASLAPTWVSTPPMFTPTPVYGATPATPDIGPPASIRAWDDTHFGPEGNYAARLGVEPVKSASVEDREAPDSCHEIFGGDLGSNSAFVIVSGFTKAMTCNADVVEYINPVLVTHHWIENARGLRLAVPAQYREGDTVYVIRDGPAYAVGLYVDLGKVMSAAAPEDRECSAGGWGLLHFYPGIELFRKRSSVDALNCWEETHRSSIPLWRL